MKICTKCSQEKSLDAFHNDKQKMDGKYSACKQCRKNGSKAYYLQNKAKKQHYAALNKDRIADYMRQYWKEHSGIAAERTLQRRAQKKSTQVEFISKERVFLRDNGICYLCLQPVGTLGWHLEHLIPFCKGGTHTYGNVAVSHSTCNLQKSRKSIWELEGQIKTNALNKYLSLNSK